MTTRSADIQRVREGKDTVWKKGRVIEVVHMADLVHHCLGVFLVEAQVSECLSEKLSDLLSAGSLLREGHSSIFSAGAEELKLTIMGDCILNIILIAKLFYRLSLLVTCHLCLCRSKS